MFKKYLTLTLALFLGEISAQQVLMPEDKFLINHDMGNLGQIDSSLMEKYTEVYSKNPLNQSTDAFKSLEFIANENGFACEKYQVTTEDGYVLGIYRIPGKLGY